MRTIVFMNAKGGVGKSVSTINIACILAYRYQKRVLVVDCDRQGNTSKFFGIPDNEYDTLIDVLQDDPMKAAEVIEKTEYDNISILPADTNISNLELLMREDSQEYRNRLKQALKPVARDYDFCLIDCPPTVNMASRNALTAADDVLIPFKSDAFSVDGIKSLSDVISDIEKYGLRLNYHIFMTMYYNSKVCKLCENTLISSSVVGNRLFNTKIRRTSMVDESTFNRPLILHYKRATATEDYIALVEEYISSLPKKRGVKQND